MSVCYQLHIKITIRSSRKFYLWTGGKISLGLHFGSHSLLAPDLRKYYLKERSTFQDRAFFIISLISLEKLSDLHEKFTIDVSLDKEVPVKF